MIYITYHTNNFILRNENVNKIPEVRICGPKIASRFVCTNANFTLDVKKENEEFKFVDSKMYDKISDSRYNDFQIKKFIITEPLISKTYLVIREPKERLKTALAQILFTDNENNCMDSFENAENILLKIMRTDAHLSWYHSDIINFLDTSFNKDIILEDLSKVKWNKFNNTSNKDLYDKVNKFLEWLNINNNSEVKSYLNYYVEVETKAYNELNKLYLFN